MTLITILTGYNLGGYKRLIYQRLEAKFDLCDSNETVAGADRVLLTEMTTLK